MSRASYFIHTLLSSHQALTREVPGKGFYNLSAHMVVYHHLFIAWGGLPISVSSLGLTLTLPAGANP